MCHSPGCEKIKHTNIRRSTGFPHTRDEGNSPNCESVSRNNNIRTLHNSPQNKQKTRNTIKWAGVINSKRSTDVLGHTTAWEVPVRSPGDSAVPCHPKEVGLRVPETQGCSSLMEDGSVCTEPKHTLPYTLNQLSVTHDQYNVNAVSIKNIHAYSVHFSLNISSLRLAGSMAWTRDTEGWMCFSHVTAATVLPQCLWKCKFPNCRTALRTGA